MWNFALEGITSFTTAPLKAATYLGLFVAVSALAYGVVVVVRTLLYGNPVPGYPSLMVVILFLGGVQLITLGILGEYVGRMFDEAKRRPLYLVDDYQPSVPSMAARLALKPNESFTAPPIAGESSPMTSTVHGSRLNVWVPALIVISYAMTLFMTIK